MVPFDNPGTTQVISVLLIPVINGVGSVSVIFLVRLHPLISSIEAVYVPTGQ